MEDSGGTGAQRRLAGEDYWLAGAVTVVLAAIVTVSGQPITVTPYLFALGFGAVLLLRRRLTGTVVLLSVLGTFAYYTLDLPTIGVALPVVGALFSAAEFGRTRIAIVAGVVVFAVALAFRLRDDPQPIGTLLGTDAAANLGLLAAAIALGYGLRARRVYVAQQDEIARLQEESARARAVQSVQAERSRISRELHDTVGHALSVIVLHAGVAGEAVGRDDRAAAAAVDRIGRQSRESLQELRTMVRLLRDGDGADLERDGAAWAGDSGIRAPGGVGPLATVRNLEPLLAALRAAGLQVDVHDSVVDELPAAVDTAAYRVVQEAVTNIVRHAVGARHVEVLISQTGDGVRVRVADDGRTGGQAGAGGAGDNGGGAVGRGGTAGGDGRGDGGGVADGAVTTGTGLVGLAERVRLLGGTLAAGAAQVPDSVVPGSGGFVVAAHIPFERNP